MEHRLCVSPTADLRAVSGVLLQCALLTIGWIRSSNNTPDRAKFRATWLLPKVVGDCGCGVCTIFLLLRFSSALMIFGAILALYPLSCCDRHCIITLYTIMVASALLTLSGALYHCSLHVCSLCNLTIPGSLLTAIYSSRAR